MDFSVDIYCCFHCIAHFCSETYMVSIGIGSFLKLKNSVESRAHGCGLNTNARHRLVGLSTLFPDGGAGKDSCGTVRRTEPYRGKRVPGCVGVLRFYSSAPLPVLCQLPVCRCHVTINLLLMPPCLPQHDAMHLLKFNVRTAPVLLPIPS